jgi:ADP-ribose pyrophosphatase YjhB (NUDIX family)
MAISEFLAGVRAKIGNDLLVLPSATACIFDESARLLVARHEGDVWATPGGLVEPDEPPEQAVVREVREELGIDITVRGIVGAYGGPQHRVVYLNGDVASYVMVAYACEQAGGTLCPDGEEILEARFVTETELGALRLASWMPSVAPDFYAWHRSSR